MTQWQLRELVVDVVFVGLAFGAIYRAGQRDGRSEALQVIRECRTIHTPA